MKKATKKVAVKGKAPAKGGKKMPPWLVKGKSDKDGDEVKMKKGGVVPKKGKC